MNLNKLTNEPYMAYQGPTSSASSDNGTVRPQDLQASSRWLKTMDPGPAAAGNDT
jgi:hypothetical protein